MFADSLNMNKILSYSFLVVAFFVVYSIVGSGCAQIGAPTGGPKDTIPPVFVGATPPNNSIHFTANKIVLSFDEYVTIDDIQNNLLVSPFPKKTPTINYKLRTVTIQLKDTLQPNTTYAVNFGRGLKDVNEGNVLKNFYYVFSTGNKIDSLKLSGKVSMAETGKVDSTMIVMLYKNANDSSVQKRKPDYLAKVKSDGTFTFHYLPAGDFRIYALKDEDGSKTYNSDFEAFAFADTDIIVSPTVGRVRLYAYVESKEKKKTTTTTVTKPAKNKMPAKFKFSTSMASGQQDLLKPLEIDFPQPLKNYDPEKIRLEDTLSHTLNTSFTLDSTRKKITIRSTWVENTDYRLIIDTTALSDSADLHLTKTDTIKFKTQPESAYGSLLFRFTNIDPEMHPVLQLVQSDSVVKSIPIKSAEWSERLFEPGDYELRILYDTNNNGRWDRGNYLKRRQPERVISLDKKLTIKADWDNEREIEL
jgi:hypothetical protein